MNLELVAVPLPVRAPFRGVWQIVRFNWPQYVQGALAIAAASSLPLFVELPVWLRIALSLAVALAAFWMLASLFASWLIYDDAPLTRWQWLTEHVDAECGGRFVNIHSGFDDTTLNLQHWFPRASWSLLDLYDPQAMTEPSIHRARRSLPPLDGTLAVIATHLPLLDNSIDAAFLLFAAHELREADQREQLFAELARTLKPGGRIVLVEHVRDVANFIAFGPGFLHFLPLGEWHRLAHVSQLRIVREAGITPFVQYFILEKDAS